MAGKAATGTRPLHSDLSVELAERWAEFLLTRTEPARDHIEHMMRQYLDRPPPGTVPAAAARGRGRPRKPIPVPKPEVKKVSTKKPRR